MQELEVVREKIQNKYRVVKTDEDLEWNRAMDLCTNIINEHLSCKNAAEIKRSSRDNDGWISVEERLPEDDIPTPKLVTALVPDRKARWDNSETFSVIVDTDVYDPDYTGKWECYKKNVIAWRPLPEPYRLTQKGARENE